MERCSGHTVKVFSQRGRQYVVSVKDGLPTCTCPTFLMSSVHGTAWCSHIEAQINTVCGWRGTSVIIPGKCPKCSKDTEPIS